MTRSLKLSGILFIVFSMAIFATSCQKESVIYETKVRNACEMDVLNTGLPFMKCDITEFVVGDITFTDIAAGEDSEYKEVESGTEYNVTITYDSYLYNADDLVWEFDQTNTEDLGTEQWTDTEESDKFIMKVEIGGLLSGYTPYFETYIAN